MIHFERVACCRLQLSLIVSHSVSAVHGITVAAPKHKFDLIEQRIVDAVETTVADFQAPRMKEDKPSCQHNHSKTWKMSELIHHGVWISADSLIS